MTNDETGITPLTDSQRAAVLMAATLLTVDQLAEHLQCSRAQIYNFLRRGLPSLKLGRSRRFRLDQVTIWLEQFSEGES